MPTAWDWLLLRSGFLSGVVVVNLDVLSDDMPEFKDFKRTYINPHILETGGEMVSNGKKAV